MALPEIEHHVHKNVESWQLFYSDVRVSGGAARYSNGIRALSSAQALLLAHLKKTGTTIKAAAS